MIHFSAVFDLLSASPLFEGVPAETVRALVSAHPPVSVARGGILYGAANEGRQLAFLLRGSALVHKTYADGARVLMSRLAAGDAFGMATLFHDAPFPTEITAETAALALYVPRGWLEAAFDTEPRLAQNFIRLLSARIHFLTRRIELLSGDTLSARLLRLLEGLSQGEVVFTLPFHYAQLALMLGISRASLYRALNALAARGVLVRDGRRITLPGDSTLQPNAMTPKEDL